jgi:hypothetical protein
VDQRTGEKEKPSLVRHGERRNGNQRPWKVPVLLREALKF